MKIKFAVVASVLLSSVVCGAQSKLDATTALFVSASQQSRVAARSGETVVIPSDIDVNSEVAVLVIFKNEALAEEYSQRYDAVYDCRGAMLLVSLSAEEIENLANSDDVVSISQGYKAKPMLEVARECTGVDAVHSGESLGGLSYTGKGVVTGLMDTGMDPNHINFQKDGQTRLSRLWVITGSNGAVTEYATPAKIASYTTDDSKETHGTHVLGIMSGSYNGTPNGGSVAIINPRTGNNQISKSKAIPYYGVATEADIAACCGSLEGSNIMIAAGNVQNYAKSVGKPAVLNLSLGHNVGPHDGTTAANKYLAEVGKEMIICMSAGNEGAYNVSLHKDFTTSSNKVSTFVSNTTSAVGAFDVWSSDDTKFQITFVAVDKTTGDVKYSYKVDTSSSKAIYLTGNYYTHPDYTHDNTFNDIFGEKAALIIMPELNANNNRFNTYVTLSLTRGNAAGNIVPGFVVEGQNGKSVDMYCTSATGMVSNGVAGYENGNASQSISDFACGDNVIVVGAYVNRVKFPSFDGLASYKGIEQNDIAPFSSYGKTFSGKQLPDIAGPGMGMLSSYSNYYINATGDKSYLSAQYGNPATDKRASYWKEMSGTSMSSPFVAGVVALWLQADPTLTVDEVKQIMKETAVNDKFTAVDPHRWGYGKIDALAGIKKILGISGIADVAVDGDDLLISQVDGGRTVDVFSAGASKVEVQLYTVGGAMAASASADGDSVQLSAENLAPGVYIVRASDGSRTATRKIVL